MANILAIESSCDDTSAAILSRDIILVNKTNTQEVHEAYGGVVPELASRKHLQAIIPLIDQTLATAGMRLDQLDALAVTQGPGLLGSLLVGINTIKALALASNLPIIGVHHMKAHVIAHFIDDPKPDFPFLCLTVSGGHTQLVVVDSDYDMEVIGSTIDDAAGEAFDKCGKMLGLSYPAGPLIDKYEKLGKPRFSFSKSNIDGLDFSFSGFKTSVLYFLQKQMKQNPQFIEENLNDLCASIQNDIIEMLMLKLEKAMLDTGIQHIGIAGGVSANSGLRQAVQRLGDRHSATVYIPQFQYCTDNAGMIAKYAHILWEKGDFVDLAFSAKPRFPMV